MPVNVRVTKRRNESDEKLIRRFNRKCKKQGVVREYREKTDYYEKPSVVRRKKAIRRQRAIDKANKANANR